MPPRKRLQIASLANGTRRSTRQQAGGHLSHGLPNVYQEMLAEVAAESADDVDSNSRPIKKRKVAEQHDSIIDMPSIPMPLPEEGEPDASNFEKDVKLPQVVFDDFEGSDESDVEFEDVELNPVSHETESELDDEDQAPLKLDFSKPNETTPQKTIQRRKPLTKAERDIRLDVHKWHLMSLLLHQASRNVWCEKEEVHALLKPLIPRKVISLLHVDETQPSYQRNHSFMKGIEEVCAIWRREWSITARGIRRAYWAESVDAMDAYDDAENPIDFDDFQFAARKREGSRDLGAQLFCALLRSVAVDARLVFSLQVLPYSGEVKPQTSSTPNKAAYIKAPVQAYNSSSRSALKKKKIFDSPHPVFWVEVLNPTTTTWIPLDPIVRNTINKPKTQFEPPASDTSNSMTYVIAFEDDNSARDVTRRYTQWFNAKTRKQRIESTKEGEQWWKKAIRTFRRTVTLPRDEVEDDQLLQRAAAEGMPKNVQDFRQHPVYVLERHIRRNEVIHPKREVGKVSTGTGKNGKLESVYRRQDVHLCRSADAWYRRGRDVKIGEQPLKRVMPTKRGVRGVSEEDENEEDREDVALYAEYQTQIYEPPPVVSGKIPKNAYGNLDVYVPSMIPAGAVHIMHPLASPSARVLGIDYTDAVTGFDFKGRQGTAVINGCIVAVEYTAAITTTIEGLEWQGTQEAQAERSRVILAVWKRMLTALRIRERIEQDYGQEADSDDSSYSDTKVEDDGGGFMLEADETAEKANEQIISMQGLRNKVPIVLPQEVVHLPIKIVTSPHKPRSIPEVVRRRTSKDEVSTENEGGGFMVNDEDLGLGDGGFVVEDEVEQEAGGFFVEDDDANDEGGGFMTDDVSDDTQMPYDNSIHNRSDKTSATRNSPLPTTVPSHSGSLNEASADHNASDLQNKLSPKDTSLRKKDIAVEARTESNIANPAMTTHKTTSNDNTDPGDDNASETSLLSHDPDEDDIVPEWLDDALDE